MPTSRILVAFSVLTITFIGCKPAAENAEPRQGPPEQYIRASLGAGENAKGTLGIIAIQKSIDMYHMQEGRYPGSLEELKKSNYLVEIPAAPIGKKFTYDAAAGKVSLADK